jgi:DNA repair ATPase RecN
MDINSIQSFYYKKLGELNLLESQKDEIERNLVNLAESLEIDIKTRSVLEALSKITENQIKDYIEPLVTEAIKSVFGYNIKFNLQFGFERNQVTVRFGLEDEQGNIVSGNIADMKGGGVLDVVSVVLRFILLELFNLKGPILLDEPGRFIDKTHQQNFGLLISSFSQKFNRQIIIVTHDDAIACVGTKHYRVYMDSGVSKIKEMEE